MKESHEGLEDEEGDDGRSENCVSLAFIFV
jgi:hypothetical protein